MTKSVELGKLKLKEAMARAKKSESQISEDNPETLPTEPTDPITDPPTTKPKPIQVEYLDYSDNLLYI